MCGMKLTEVWRSVTVAKSLSAERDACARAAKCTAAACAARRCARQQCYMYMSHVGAASWRVGRECEVFCGLLQRASAYPGNVQ